jgi:hypothetical protein
MTEHPAIVVNQDVVFGLKCRHGCDEAIVGVFYFPDGCVCLEERIQALCRHHMERAASNIVHGSMRRLLSFGDWPQDAPLS